MSYCILTLGDILTAEELAGQPFAADTVLNDPAFMHYMLGAKFAQMGDEERRKYVLYAVGFAKIYGAPLRYAMLDALMYDSAPVPPRSPFYERGGQ